MFALGPKNLTPHALKSDQTLKSAPAESSNLDFLRATAVLAVYFSHLCLSLGIEGPQFFGVRQIGYLGVLIFFVHTSLVLMMSMNRSLGRTRSLSADFYFRRFFRIYPLSSLTVLFFVVVKIPPLPWVQCRTWGYTDIIQNLFLTQNVRGGPSVCGPMWSLPFEIQMYIVLPLIFLTLTTGRSIPKVMGAWALASIAYIVLRRLSLPLPASLVQYCPCFLGGVLAYVLKKKQKPIFPASWWVIGLLAVLAASILIQGVPIFRKLALDWCLCLLLGFAIPHFNEITSKWLRLTSHAIAKYSYSIYLLHVPAMWFSFKVLRAGAAWRWAALAMLSVGLPAVAYHAVESPGIETGRWLTRRLFSMRQPEAQAS